MWLTLFFYLFGLAIRYFIQFTQEENWQYRMPFNTDRFKYIRVVWRYTYALGHLLLLKHEIYYFLMLMLIDRLVHFRRSYFWNSCPMVLLLLQGYSAS